MIINGMAAAAMRLGRLLKFSYTGKYGYKEDGSGNWELRLMNGGVLTMNDDCAVDIFAVGGGGSGGLPRRTSTTRDSAGGGGGGYTATVSNYSIARGAVLTAVIGAGGVYPTTSAANSFDGSDGGTTKMYTGTVEGSGTSVISAAGGKGGHVSSGILVAGDGGSGGGIAVSTSQDYAGGSNGGNGQGTYAGSGQGTTTKAFGDTNGELFSGGGGGGASGAYPSAFGAGGNGGGANGGYTTEGGSVVSARNAASNTGGGGGGGGWTTYADTDTHEYVKFAGGNGGSGIIIIRNHR